MRIIDRVKILWWVARSETLAVLTDNQAIIHLPLHDPSKFESQFMLSAQTSALHEFRSRLDNLIEEHDENLKLLIHRQGKKSRRNNSRKHKTAKANK